MIRDTNTGCSVVVGFGGMENPVKDSQMRTVVYYTIKWLIIHVITPLDGFVRRI